MCDILLRLTIELYVIHTVEKSGGTQIKMTMQFDNGMLALAKPMRLVGLSLCVCVCVSTAWKLNQLFI